MIKAENIETTTLRFIVLGLFKFTVAALKAL